MNTVVLDYETGAIESRPDYPPKPVGVALIVGETKQYYAFGHPEGNNCTEEDAKRAVTKALRSADEIVVHNLKFEYEVTQKWLGWVPTVDKFQDTLILAFLNDPHSDTLALKPLSEKLLNIPPAERDAVRDWILANVPEAKRKPSSWGAHICKAPGGLVGEYAIGDVVRTQALFKMLIRKVIDAGMGSAYAREKALIPIMLRNEQEGITCDVHNLEIHAAECEEDLEKTDEWVRRHLSAPSLNLDENEHLADALEEAGKVSKWILTEKGTRSTAKPALDKMLDDRLLYAALMYRGSMATCVRTFMRPWLSLSHSNNGRLYTTWNTTRQEEGGGTRTGRLSSSKPLNLQNIPNAFDDKLGGLFEETNLLDTLDVGGLPNLRSYIVADTPDHVLLGRDLSSQEPRTFAYFEEGWLANSYIEDPKMDVYRALMAQTKSKTGVAITRKQAKTIFLGILYGMGAGKLAAQLDLTAPEAVTIKSAMMDAIPSIGKLSKFVQRKLAEGGSVTTWGGRRYYVEPAKRIGEFSRTFEYKGLNVLVQGSAADETKEALIRYESMRGDSRLLLQVHDELVICAHKDSAAAEMKKLRESMEGLDLGGVPLLSEGEAGYRWGDMEEYADV